MTYLVVLSYRRCCSCVRVQNLFPAVVQVLRGNYYYYYRSMQYLCAVSTAIRKNLIKNPVVFFSKYVVMLMIYGKVLPNWVTK